MTMAESRSACTCWHMPSNETIVHLDKINPTATTTSKHNAYSDPPEWRQHCSLAFQRNCQQDRISSCQTSSVSRSLSRQETMQCCRLHLTSDKQQLTMALHTLTMPATKTTNREPGNCQHFSQQSRQMICCSWSTELTNSNSEMMAKPGLERLSVNLQVLDLDLMSLE